MTASLFTLGFAAHANAKTMVLCSAMCASKDVPQTNERSPTTNKVFRTVTAVAGTQEEALAKMGAKCGPTRDLTDGIWIIGVGGVLVFSKYSYLDRNNDADAHVGRQLSCDSFEI